LQHLLVRRRNGVFVFAFERIIREKNSFSKD